MDSISPKYSPCLVPQEKILNEPATSDGRVAVSKNRFERWLQTIYNTQDEEISCSECFDLMSHFVEVELVGEEADIKLPQLKQHLEQCPACRQEYETLRDIRILENKGELPSVDDLEDLIP